MTFSSGPYRGYRGGYSYGCEFHFQWEKLPEGGAVVYNVVDGAVWAHLAPDLNTNRYDFSHAQAARLCLAFNGNPRTDISGIDGTP